MNMILILYELKLFCLRVICIAIHRKFTYRPPPWMKFKKNYPSVTSLVG